MNEYEKRRGQNGNEEPAALIMFPRLWKNTPCFNNPTQTHFWEKCWIKRQATLKQMGTLSTRPKMVKKTNILGCF